MPGHNRIDRRFQFDGAAAELGLVSLTPSASIAAIGIASAEAYGVSLVELQTVHAVGIASAEGYGHSTVGTSSSSSAGLGGGIALGIGIGVAFSGARASSASSASTSLPPVTSGLVLLADAANALASGVTPSDGAAITDLIDFSGQNNHGVEGGTGAGPKYLATSWAGEPCLEFRGTTQWLKFTTAGIVNAAVGNDNAFTVITVVRPRLISQTLCYYWSWAQSSSGTRFFSTRTTSSTSFRVELISSTATGAKTAITSSKQVHGSPVVLTVRRPSGTSIQYGFDGVHESAQAADIDALSGDMFVLGAQGGTAPTIDGEHWIRSILVYNRSLTDQEVAQVEQWCASHYAGLSWKSGLGGTITGGEETLIFLADGQSNAQGQATTLPFWTPTGANEDMIALDGFRKRIYEPFHDGTNQSAGQVSHIDPTAAGGWGTRLADRLRERLGSSHRILVVPCALNSTSAATWATGLTTSPQVMNTLYGSSWHRIKEALQAPSAVIGSIIVLQGESEAQVSQATADAWATSWWTPILDQYNADFAGKFWKTAHFTIIKIASNVTRTWVSNVRAAQSAMVAGRSDCLIYDPPGVTLGGLHFDTAENNTIGVAVADLIYAAA